MKKLLCMLLFTILVLGTLVACSSKEPEVAECDHVWSSVTTPPTCSAIGYDTMTCSLCKKSIRVNETEKLAHTYSASYFIDDTSHWLRCTVCDAINDKELHALDSEGVCTICQLPISPNPCVIYDISADGTYAMVIGYNGTATKVKIDSAYKGLPVKHISGNAFMDNRTITSVLIPDSVTIIGMHAFDGCSNLTSVTIPNSVTIIDWKAFAGCSKLTSVVIPNSVTSIGDFAFFGCSKLASVVIPNSVTSIGASAFYNCNPSLYTEYGFGKYIGSKDNPYAILIEITNKEISGYTINETTKHIAGGVFEYCSNLTSIAIPNSVTIIGPSAFFGCSNLTSVVIPDSVTIIGSSAFQACHSLTSITIPNSVTIIGSSAFLACDGLTSIMIPDSVTIIDYWAFRFCSSLSSVIIGDSVTSIGSYAFGDCDSLSSVIIGDSVTSIGSYAFGNCDSLKDVYYTGSEEKWNAISINSNNALNSATKHYNYVSNE